MEHEGAVHAEVQGDLKRLDRRLTILTPDDAAVAKIYGAGPGTLYLLRPDLHIAGRWKTIRPEEVVGALRAGLGGGPR